MSSKKESMSWFERLKEKWGLKSMGQVVVVLIVFACTGFTVLFLKRPIVAFFSEDGEQSGWFTFFYWLLIFPIYNVILLGYGFLFGQFEFFWNYEKKTINRFRRKKKTPEVAAEGAGEES